MIFQTSCSELLVDTGIHDSEIAFEKFKRLFKEVGWETSPPVTAEILERMKREWYDYYERNGAYPNEVTVYDKDGNHAYIEYGVNGYITTGYRFDSNCNDGNIKCYPMFKMAIDKLNGELIACDGGTKAGYEEWDE